MAGTIDSSSLCPSTKIEIRGEEEAIFFAFRFMFLKKKSNASILHDSSAMFLKK